MKEHILNIDVFNKIFYKSDLLKGCFFCFVFSIVQHFNKNIDMFLLNDIYFYKDAEGTNRLALISKSNIDWMDIANELHIDLEARVYCKELLLETRRAIQNERPVIISVDDFYLPFATREGHFSQYVLVEGYNEDNDTFNIRVQRKRYDVFYVKEIISSQQLKTAYEGYMVLYHTIHKIREGKDFPTYYSFMNMDDFKPNINAAITRYKKYIEENIETIKYGLSIMNNFIARLTFGGIEIDYAEFMQDVNNIISIMRVQLYTFKNCIANKGIVENILNKLIAEWDRVRFILIKSDMKGISYYKMKTMVVDKLNLIANLETRYYELLEQFSKSVI